MFSNPVLIAILLVDLSFLYDKTTYLAYLMLFFAALIGTGYCAVTNIEQERWQEGYTLKFWKMLLTSLFVSLLVFGIVLHYELAFFPGLILTLVGSAQPEKIKLLIASIFKAVNPIQTSTKNEDDGTLDKK